MRFIIRFFIVVRNFGGTRRILRAALSSLRANGIAGLSRKISLAFRRVKMGSNNPRKDFPEWMRLYSSYANLQSGETSSKTRPLISVIMPVFNPKFDHLKFAIESVINQSYKNWELCIVDDCSTKSGLKKFLETYSTTDSRIKVKYRDSNGHISAASNDALAMSTGSYVTFLDHDDELVPWALESVARQIDEYPTARMFYSDEAIVDEDSKVVSGHLKGGLNRTLAWCYNYFCHLTVYSKSLVDELGGFTEGMEGAQDYDLALRALEILKDSEIRHIPEVLYFWRAAGVSTAVSIENKPYALTAGHRAVSKHLERLGINGAVEPSDQIRTANRVRIEVEESENRVSVIIPTRDNPAVLRTCVESILKKTNYNNYEVIIVDNGSKQVKTLEYLDSLANTEKITVLTIDEPFNYPSLNNSAAAIATGKHLLLINDDTKVINADWMRELVSFSQLSHVGAVGAKLLYPDNRVQHAGVILGIGAIAGHAQRFLFSEDWGYAGRAVLHQDFAAVTGACLMVKKDLYDKVSGLDEQLAVSYNDVDFCLRLHESGYRNVYTPHAQLYHFESVSRGSDESPANISRAEREVALMKQRWVKLLDSDPYYSTNFATDSETYEFATPPRL
jgi:O-antigen biosynthesis protein